MRLAILNLLRTLLVLAAAVSVEAADATALRLTVVGRTGDGKSALCNLLLRYFDSSAANVFPESDDAKSQTGVPLTKVAGNIRITDTPGLVDTRGYLQDDQNIDTIVAHVKREELNHGFLLVINEQAPRFDQALQDSVKRLLDTFGKPMLRQLGVVFTKAWHKSDQESALFVENQIVPMIQELDLNLTVPKLPSWQVDCHPEALFMLGASEEFVQGGHEKNRAAVLSILRWLYQNEPMSTLETTAAQNALQQKLQELQDKLEEEKQRRQEAERLATLMSSKAEKLLEDVYFHRQNSIFMLFEKTENIARTVLAACAIVFLFLFIRRRTKSEA